MSELHHVPQHSELGMFSFRTSFTQMLLIASLVVVSIYSVNFYRKRWKWYYHSWSVPGPLALPIVGAAYKIFGDPVQRTSGMLDVMGSHPDIVKVWLGSKLVYMISKPEYIEKLINHPNLIEKDDFYSLIAEYLGDGILTSKGAKWKSHRKIMTRSFHQKMLDSFVDEFDEQASIFVDILKKYAGQHDLPIYLLAIRCHLDDACGTTMGVKTKVQTAEDDVGETLQRLVEIFGKKIFMIRYHSDLIWNHSAHKKAGKLGAKRIKEICLSVVKNKMKDYEEKQQNEKYDHVIDDGSSVQRKAMLDLLIENSDLTEEELRDEVTITLLAASETSANATVYILLILGLYPDIQQKVYEEVMEVLGPEKNVEPEDLPKLAYLERVIKESMRLFPVISMVGRYVAKDVDIGDYVAPAGITIGFPIIHIHRSPNYWKDPMKFDPDRFLPANVAARHPLTYMPFSSGIRNCIGWRYAMMNLTTLTARIVRELKVFTEYKCLEEIGVEMHVFTRIKDGPKIWFEARQ